MKKKILALLLAAGAIVTGERLKDADDHGVPVRSGGGSAGVAGAAVRCGGSAGAQTCSHTAGQQECKNLLFHNVTSF